MNLLIESNSNGLKFEMIDLNKSNLLDNFFFY